MASEVGTIVLNGDPPPMREFREAAANGGAALIVNQSGLPDDDVRQVIAERWVELSAFTPGGMGSLTPRQTQPSSTRIRTRFSGSTPSPARSTST
jgi:hypothetical protein